MESTKNMKLNDVFRDVTDPSRKHRIGSTRPLAYNSMLHHFDARYGTVPYRIEIGRENFMEQKIKRINKFFLRG